MSEISFDEFGQAVRDIGNGKTLYLARQLFNWRLSIGDTGNNMWFNAEY